MSMHLHMYIYLLCVMCLHVFTGVGTTHVQAQRGHTAFLPRKLNHSFSHFDCIVHPLARLMFRFDHKRSINKQLLSAACACSPSTDYLHWLTAALAWCELPTAPHLMDRLSLTFITHIGCNLLCQKMLYELILGNRKSLTGFGFRILLRNYILQNNIKCR